MESNQLNLKSNDYIVIEKNKILNTKAIRWIEEYDNCYELCTKQSGCKVGSDTQSICKDSKYYKEIRNFYESVMNK